MIWLLNFLLVLTIEYIQNIPIIIGIVLGLSAIKRGLAWWKVFLFFAGGSFVSALVITATDWIKVRGTTRTTELPSLAGALYMGVLFFLGCGVMALYFWLTGKLKRPYLADILFGFSLGALTAVLEVPYLPPGLVLLHALGFAAAGSAVTSLLRRSSGDRPGRKRTGHMLLITLVMTLLIMLFDYLPFIRTDDFGLLASLMTQEMASLFAVTGLT